MNLFKRTEEPKSWTQKHSIKVKNILSNKKVLTAVLLTGIAAGVAAYKYQAQLLPPPNEFQPPLPEPDPKVWNILIGTQVTLAAYGALSFFCPKMMAPVHKVVKVTSCAIGVPLFKGTVLALKALKVVLCSSANVVSFFALPVLRGVGVCLKGLGRVLQPVVYAVAKLAWSVLTNLASFSGTCLHKLAVTSYHIASGIAKVVKPILVGMSNLVRDGIWPVVRLALKGLGTLASFLTRKVVVLLGEAAHFFSNMWPTVRRVLQGLGRAIGSIVSFSTKRVVKILREAYNLFRGNMWPAVSLALRGLGRAIGSFVSFSARRVIEVLGEASNLFRVNIWPAVREALEGLGRATGSLASFVARRGVELMRGASNLFITTILPVVRSALTGLGTFLTGRGVELLRNAFAFFEGHILPAMTSALKTISVFALKQLGNLAIFAGKVFAAISWGVVKNAALLTASMVWAVTKPILKSIATYAWNLIATVPTYSWNLVTALPTHSWNLIANQLPARFQRV
ncbi:MAG: hypothetical protein Q8K75_08415 [Chlamydiales bacterium]|nr:hypothetical protein [Chlamydiales bacterium]